MTSVAPGLVACPAASLVSLQSRLSFAALEPATSHDAAPDDAANAVYVLLSFASYVIAEEP